MQNVSNLCNILRFRHKDIQLFSKYIIKSHFIAILFIVVLNNYRNSQKSQ